MLAAPIVIVSLLLCFFAINLLFYLLNEPFSLSEKDLTLPTFLAHQGVILLGCLLALLFVLPVKLRWLSVLLFLLFTILTAWHFYRLTTSSFYSPSGTVMMKKRETAREILLPIDVWHTWLTGLQWTPHIVVRLKVIDRLLNDTILPSGKSC